MVRPRRYLSGLDWLIHAMNSSAHRCGPTGNSSQIVVAFDRPLDEQLLRNRLEDFIACFPILAGHAVRPWTLEPHWRVPRRGVPRPPRLVVIEPQEERAAAFARCANQPFEHPREYMRFFLHHGSDNRSALLFSFDHRILDARGAELFLQLFLRFCNGDVPREALAEANITSRPSLLNEWVQRFESGKVVRRVLRGLAQETAFSPISTDLAHGPSHFLPITLTRAETRHFMERAEKEAGFMMFMPYALTAAAKAFAAAFGSAECALNLSIPCTIDLRGNNPPLSKLFFNYCAMLFFRIEDAGMQQRGQMIQSIKQQFYQQRKENLPYCLEHVMALMRILPVRTLDAIICLMRKKRPFSFAFASLGVSGCDGGSLGDAQVVNCYHLPHVPPHVGIGFFYTQCNNRITLTVSARGDLLNAEQGAAIERTIREAFA